MATYVIGDVHGCFDSLQALLERMPRHPDRDRMWMVGDLVNRGPRSLETLRWARGMERRLGERFVTVLGNHDLHLLRRALGMRRGRPLDTLEPVIEADDGEELVEWLAHRPLFHRQDGRVLVHAGLPPGWGLREVARRARRAETALRSHHTRRAVLDREAAEGGSEHVEQARETLGFLASMRCVDAASGALCDFSGHPDDAPSGCIPWFRHPGWRYEDQPVVFGHWSALGFHREPAGPQREGEGTPVTCLDSGCVWRRGLTALRLDDGEVFVQPTLEPADELPGRDW